MKLLAVLLVTSLLNSAFASEEEASHHAVSLVPASGWKYLSMPSEVKAMVSISNGGLGTWAVDSDHAIYYLGEHNEWVRTGGALMQISVGRSVVWGVTADGYAYYGTSMSIEPGWRHVSGIASLKEISVSQMNHVWGINNEHQVYHFQGDDEWRLVSGVSLAQISVGSSGVWGVDIDGEVYYRQGTYGDEEGIGSEWKYIATPSSFIEVSSAAGFVIGICKMGYLHKRITNDEEPAGTTWTLLNGQIHFKSIDAGLKYLYGITTTGKLVLESTTTVVPAFLPDMNLPSNGWMYLSMPSGVTTVDYIVSGGLGTWAVDADHQIYYLGANNKWTLTGGALMQISVGGKQIWGVNSDYQIYFGTSMSAEPGWTRVEGALKQVSVSELDHVWGVSAENGIYYYQGENHWEHVEGALMQISVGSSGVWGVASNYRVYYRIGTYGDEAGMGSDWLYVKAPVSFKEVSSGIGFVMALDLDGQVYMRYTTAEHPYGTEWVLVNSQCPFKTIDAGTKYSVGVGTHSQLVIANLKAVVAFQAQLPHVTVPTVGWKYVGMPTGVTIIRNVANGGLGTWAVDADYQIYYLGANNKWVLTSGGLMQIAVGGNQVWGVNSDYQIYFSTSMSAHPEWQHVKGSLKQVSVSALNHVWGVSSGDYVYHYENGHFEYVKGQYIIQISVGPSGVWGVSYYYGKVYYRQGTYGDMPGVGAEWVLVKTPAPFTEVSSGPGYVIGLTKYGQLYKTLTTAEHPTGTGWFLLNQQKQFKSIDAGSQYVWSVERNGKLIVESATTIVKATLTVDGWEGIDMPTGVTAVKCIASGGLGTWAVDADYQIYYLGANNKWTLTGGALMQISVGGHQVWGVNSKGQVYFGTSMSTEPGWELVTGATLTQVAVSENDHVWGVNSKDQIYYYQGGNKWQLVSGALKQISVGASGVWGVNSRNWLYYKTGTYGDECGSGCDWKYVGAYYKEVSSGPGYILALNTKGKLYKRVTSAKYPTGTEWILLNNLHTFETIDAGLKYIWGVEANGNLIEESATKIIHGLAGAGDD